MYQRAVRRQIVRIFLLFLLLSSLVAHPLHAYPAWSGGGADPEQVVERRVYFAMWTLHFRELERGIDNNWAFGMSWGRIYGATLINSFGNRAYSGGVQGTLTRWEPRALSLGLGYRAGLITGYDERFIPLAGRTPVIPLLQPLLRLDADRLGVELSYSGVVASLGLNARF